MYSVVLMVAVTTGGDTASFGGKDKGAGCHGTVASASCHGGGFLGLRGNGCSGGGLFSGKHKSSGCHGTTVGAGCTGAAAMPAPAPAPAPAPVAAPAGCTGHTAGASCHGGGFLGLRGNGCSGGGGLFSGKHKSKGCNGGCHGW